MISKNSKIFIAGHKGLVGSALHKKLKKEGFKNILVKKRKELDLTNQLKVNLFFKKNKIEYLIICAAKVGGIMSNLTFPTEFMYENLMIQTNLIHASYLAGVKKLIFLGSSCIYPKFAKQPIKEDYLLSGKLEPTNDAYAIAKISGVKMCDAYNKQYGLNYICLMPTNLYGPNDNYDLNNSHFYPALISKIYNAKIKKKKSIEIWGNGNAKRELMYVDDLANACEYFLKKKTRHTLINIGSGDERTIKEYSKFIMKKLNINLRIVLNKKKPTGTPRKTLNTNLARSYGWRSRINLNLGFDLTYQDFLKKLK